MVHFIFSIRAIFFPIAAAAMRMNIRQMNDLLVCVSG